MIGYPGSKHRRNSNPLLWFIDQMNASKVPSPVRDHIIRLATKLPRKCLNVTGFSYDDAYTAMKALMVRMNLMRSQYELMNTPTDHKSYFTVSKTTAIWIGADAKFKSIKTVRRLPKKERMKAKVPSGDFIVPEREDVA